MKALRVESVSDVNVMLEIFILEVLGAINFWTVLNTKVVSKVQNTLIPKFLGTDQ